MPIAEGANSKPKTGVSSDKPAAASKPTIYGFCISSDKKWIVVGCDDYTIKQVSLGMPEEVKHGLLFICFMLQ